ncbi:hypothetical protein ACFX1T_032812 [Malus domestica]
MFMLVAAVFDIFNFEKTEHGVGTLTELSSLIGASRGGLDHPEKIHGTNCSGTNYSFFFLAWTNLLGRDHGMAAAWPKEEEDEGE